MKSYHDPAAIADAARRSDEWEREHPVADVAPSIKAVTRALGRPTTMMIVCLDRPALGAMSVRDAVSLTGLTKQSIYNALRTGYTKRGLRFEYASPLKHAPAFGIAKRRQEVA